MASAPSATTASSLSLQDETDAIVKSSLENLVKHFSQPIHRENKAPSPVDVLLQRPLGVSPVTQHILASLQSQQNVQNVILRWMEGYSRLIQPVLLDSHGKLNSTGVPVLSQYELVLSTLLDEHGVTNDSQCQLQQVASDIVVLLARDVSLLTEIDMQYRLSVCHIDAAAPLGSLHSISPITQNKQAMQTCAVTLLAFGDSIHVQSLMDIQPYTTLLFHDISVNVGTDWLKDWETVRLDGSGWNDATSGIASRAAMSCWNALDAIVSVNDDAIHSNDDSKKHETTTTIYFEQQQQ